MVLKKAYLLIHSQSVYLRSLGYDFNAVDTPKLYHIQNLARCHLDALDALCELLETSATRLQSWNGSNEFDEWAKSHYHVSMDNLEDRIMACRKEPAEVWGRARRHIFPHELMTSSLSGAGSYNTRSLFDFNQLITFRYGKRPKVLPGTGGSV